MHRKTFRALQPLPYTTVGILLLFVLELIILAVVPQERGFWLDETISWWVTEGPFTQFVSRSLTYQAPSPLYFILLWCWRLLGGGSELWCRSLSFLFFLGSLGFLCRLARQLSFSQGGTLFTLLTFISLEEVTRTSFNARPYALALCCTLCSTSLLLDWMRRQDFSSATLYALSFLFVVYAHYAFVFLIVVHALFFYSQQRSFPKYSRWVMCVWLLGGVPGILHLSFILRAPLKALSFARQPTFLEALTGLFPRHLVVYLVIGLIVARINSSFFQKKPRSSVLTFLLGWALIPEVLISLLSWLSGTSLFVDRYYLWRAGGIALLVGETVSTWCPPRAQKILLAVWFFLAFFLEGQRVWLIEDWKGAARHLNEEVLPTTPVLVYSGIVEAETVDWEPNSEAEQYVLAPFQTYPVKQKIFAIPSTTEDKAKTFYWKERIVPVLREHTECVVVLLAHPKFQEITVPLKKRYTEELSALGFTQEKSTSHGQVIVLLFRRSEQQAGT